MLILQTEKLQEYCSHQGAPNAALKYLSEICDLYSSSFFMWLYMLPYNTYFLYIIFELNYVSIPGGRHLLILGQTLNVLCATEIYSCMIFQLSMWMQHDTESLEPQHSI